MYFYLGPYRMAGIKGCIADLTYAELPPIVIKPEIHTRVDNKNRKLASRIPLLSEGRSSVASLCRIKNERVSTLCLPP